MDYATVIAAFFDPAAAELPTPEPVHLASPARRLRDAFEPLSMHAVWSPLVHERMAAHGLDFFGTYVGGRASVMGDPKGAVVAAAFAAFEPGMIGGVWEQARSQLDSQVLRDLTIAATGDSLRSVLGNDDRMATVADRLSSVVSSLDPTGRPLFSGVQALEVPQDSHTRLWQACLALREHRGDSHVAAYISAGLDPVRMNILTELWLGYALSEYSASRAWPEDRTAAALGALEAEGLISADHAITDAGRSIRSAIEARTDAMEADVVAALGESLVSTTDALAAWSEQCVAAKTFPPDPRKRAAG